MAKTRKRTPAAERFWVHVGRDGRGCWDWWGAVNSAGYPVMKVNGRVVMAQRFAWRLTYDEDIPPGHRVMRTCGNRRCMNVDHWRLRLWGDEGWDEAAKEAHRARYRASRNGS